MDNAAPFKGSLIRFQ